MLIAGGLSFLGLGKVSKKTKNAGLLKIAILGSAVITATELIFGIIFNVILKKNVWDYSKLPFNLGGQICARYSILWGLLSIIIVPLAATIDKNLQKE